MRHPNVHRLMGVIIFKGLHLGMVSEWMENGNLHEYMRKNPDCDCYLMCKQITSGLAYIHERKAVHGDVKAMNVLLSPDGVAKLTDFGMSTMSETSLAFSDSSNPNLGTVRWAAPELLAEVFTKTKESDIYALGMCKQDYSVMMAVLSGTLPTRPADKLKSGPRGDHMWELLLKCWDREPGVRPPAKEMVELLSSISGESE
ncbi:putative serine/threonine-protein kinase DDB_G0284251 [Rhizoctonia solani AG-1 IB]|uniref:Protein kinase domain-containing protein n=2 Tax=Rhizoctonia solani TaxID=456999 RepID=A0A8H3GL43_9AGAM|nr:unnamed protein product [Rhizoctonia solani]CCO31791.1 putative serine/threonine-protein kinase DDB_G0284251 [Rhizoctonia solani AG-1 IB]